MGVFLAPLRLHEGAHMKTAKVKEEDGAQNKEQRAVRWCSTPE